jgi:hypothetical protein
MAAWLLLLFPPLFYASVFRPCTECYDFRQVLTHEAGHLLGLDHPDIEGRNMRATAPMSGATCRSEALHARGMADAPAESMMLRLAQHSQHGCLSDDDLEGLNFLYPTCDGALSAVRCDKSSSRVGLLRLCTSIGLPLTVALTATLLVAVFVSRRKSSQLREAHAELIAVRIALGPAQSAEMDRIERSRRSCSAADANGRSRSRGGHAPGARNGSARALRLDPVGELALRPTGGGRRVGHGPASVARASDAGGRAATAGAESDAKGVRAGAASALSAGESGDQQECSRARPDAGALGSAQRAMGGSAPPGSKHDVTELELSV